jgi:hypothetical protein
MALALTMAVVAEACSSNWNGHPRSGVGRSGT